MNFVTPDNGEEYIAELNNSTLTNIKGFQAEKPDLTITIDRADLETVMMGQATFDDQITAGKARLTGDHKPYDQLKSMLVQFQIGFEILPGTKAVKPADVRANPFEQKPPAVNTITD
jgi:alkyl sulfatase BDS1-like metallo-beta-lactamase superfamily hydrolase